MSTAKTVLFVIGIIALVVAVGAISIGGLSVWGHLAKADEDGFMPGNTADLARDSHAIVVNNDMESGDKAVSTTTSNDFLMINRITSKVKASNNDPSKEIFIGIGKDSDVESYLSGIEYHEMPFLQDDTLPIVIRTESRHSGSSQPTNPQAEVFWIASAYGQGTQAAEWEYDDSDYSIVLMNADGSAGVNISAATSSKSSPSWLVWGIVYVLVGVVALAVGITFVYITKIRKQTPK